MIVFQIDIDGVAFRPAESDPPVSAGGDCIAAFVRSNEGMKAKGRQVHILWPRCVIERAQDVRDPRQDETGQSYVLVIPTIL